MYIHNVLDKLHHCKIKNTEYQHFFVSCRLEVKHLIPFSTFLETLKLEYSWNNFKIVPKESNPEK